MLKSSQCSARALSPPMPWHKPYVRMKNSDDVVVLLHGLWRSKEAMRSLADYLYSELNVTTCSIPYPSYSKGFDYIVSHVKAEIDALGVKGRVHFVTHSLGGLIVRGLMHHPEFYHEVGRVVMLSPPNNGSQIVDWLQGSPLRHVLGPAGVYLSKEKIHDCIPPIKDVSKLAVIMGTMNRIKIFAPFLDMTNDGIVSVDDGKVDDHVHFTTVPKDHTFIMQDRQVFLLTLEFIKTGTWEKM